MANCFECKVYGLAINALCPDCDEEGNPEKPCYQFEPKVVERGRIRVDEVEKLKAKNKAYEGLLHEIHDNLWDEGLSSIDMINICEKIKKVLKEEG